MYVTMSVDIDAPPERVWQFLVEPEKAQQWFHLLKKYEWTSEPGGIGSTFSWVEEASGRVYEIDFKTTEWDPPHVFGFSQVRSNAFKSYDERWVIEPTESGCRFTFNDRIGLPYGPLNPIIGWFAARGARKTGAEIQANLKRLAQAAD